MWIREVEPLMTPSWSSAVVVLSFVASLFSRLEAQGKPASEAGSLVYVAAAGHLSASYQLPLPPVSQRIEGPASRYANLSPAKCRRMLKGSEHKNVFERLGSRNGIATPLRFVEPLMGIKFKVPPKKSLFGNLDCRQALLWIELAPVLIEHGVVGLQIDNFYRNRARIRKGRKSQHAYGLAADVTAIYFGAEEGAHRSKTGAVLPSGSGRADIEEDFLGRRGTPVCGPKARILPRADSDQEQVARATRLRNLVCDLARRGGFHHMLTPNYDVAHRNHLHLDIKRDNKWFSVQ